MKVRTQVGEVLEASSLRQLAELLWQTKFIPEATIEEWVEGSARRAAQWDGSVLSTSSPEAHVEDLIRKGFLTVLE